MAKNPHVSFTLNQDKDKDIINFITRLPDGEKSQKFREIFRAGIENKKPTEKPISELDENIKKEKLLNFKIHRAHTLHKIKNVIQDTKLKRAQTNFIELYNQPISKSGMKMLKSSISDDNPSENPVNENSNYIQCNICGIVINFEPTSANSVAVAKEKFIDHKWEKHRQGLSLIEKEKLMELKPILR